MDVPLESSSAFETLVDELGAALVRHGLRFAAGPTGGIIHGSDQPNRVTHWEHGRRIRLEWRAASWQPDDASEIDVRFEPIEGGTRITMEHRGWDRLIYNDTDLIGWFASEVVAPVLTAMTPTGLGDWITDRGARRPSGAPSREVYRDPLYHYPNFRVILNELALTPSDYLLEIACGGGALMKDALKSGCRAAAIDHSLDMVRVARETNRSAVAAGNLDIVQASAEQLPFRDAGFTAAAMTGVLGFLRDPVGALAEVHRVLAQGGRFVTLGSDPELRGTPAAPEPFASRLRFYDDDELESLGRAAGFESVQVIRRDLELFAREAGVPEEHLALFAGPTTRFLVAHKM
ncbi:MAG TPA: methyltransferase domain-containing protein [Longimicrobiales bacterium]|nr:methyltransferase domain-containing protein [Longimicrobiales bacterium]